MAFKKSLAAVVVFALPFILGSPAKRSSDSCGFLDKIGEDLIVNVFEKECGDMAHAALRLSFHDAIGFSKILGGGGADGSIIVYSTTELKDPGNDGVDEFLDVFIRIYNKYKDEISPGDFIQYAAALSLSLCPGAPKVKFSIGRPQPTGPAPNFIVPQPINTTDEILAAFAAVDFSPQEVVALLASHSVAGADDLSPPLTGVPFDSTPSVFDTNIYVEVLLNGTLFVQGATTYKPGVVGTAIQGTMRLQSDFELARDPRTACYWQSFATDQESMATQFAAAFYKMGLLGQANNNNLIDCSSAIPDPPSLSNNKIEFPPGLSVNDIDQSCSSPFPNLPTAEGPPLNAPLIPQGVDS